MPNLTTETRNTQLRDCLLIITEYNFDVLRAVYGDPDLPEPEKQLLGDFFAKIRSKLPVSAAVSPTAQVLGWDPIDLESGQLMTIEEFRQAVAVGAFVDDDGFGDFATATEVSNVTIQPSKLADTKIPEGATHVLWYNQ